MKDVDEIVVGADGTIRVAPVGTAAPADEVTAPGAGWVDLGYSNEDGATLRVTKDVATIGVWQLAAPARYVVRARGVEIETTLVQWRRETFELAVGGGTASTPTVGHHKFELDAVPALDERALMLDWVDSHNYRLVIPRGLVTSNLEAPLRRAEGAPIPLTFAAMGSDAAAIAYLLTDDPAFAPAA